MGRRDILKSIGCCFGFGGLFIGMMILFAWITKSVQGIILSGMLTLVVILVIVGHFYPIWFKDYIEDFYARQEAKNVKKEK